MPRLSYETVAWGAVAAAAFALGWAVRARKCTCSEVEA